MRMAMIEKSTGLVKLVYPSGSVFGGPFGDSNLYAHVEVDDGLSDKLSASLINGEWVLSDNIDALKQIQVNELYDQLNEEVLEEMKDVFGTTKTESATANYETWKLMRDNPASFSATGLVCDMDLYDGQTKVMEKGQALDSADEIQKYAILRIKLALDYANWRLLKVQTFSLAKDAILGG